MMQRWKILLMALVLSVGCEGAPTAPNGDSDDDMTITQDVDVTVVVHQHPPDSIPPADDPQQPNRPPVLVQPLAQSSVATQAVSLQIIATDPDGDELTYSAGGLPRGLSINSVSAVITGTISTSSPGDSPFTPFVSVSDGLRSDTKHFTWVVTEPVSG